MDAWVYHSARRHAEADELVARLRASGEFATVIPANSRYYNGEIHRGCVVYHDDSRRDLVWAHERHGVELRQFAGREMGSEVRVDPEDLAQVVGVTQPLPAARVTDPPAEIAREVPEEQRGEWVEQKGMWFTAFRNGQKVGKAQRSEDEAWALLGGRPPEK